MSDEKEKGGNPGPKKSRALGRPKPQVEMTPETLISQAISNNVPVETMEKLLAMRREFKAEYAKEQFDRSMALFQAECPVIKKEEKVMEKNSETKVRYKYAKLEAIVEQVKELISKNGFSYSFDEEKDDKDTKVLCRITHVDGHSQVTTFKIPIGSEQYMSDVQKHGSRMTFAKRYAFCNAFGIMTGDEDNDAQGAPGDNQEKAPRKSKFDDLLEKLPKVKKDQLDTFLAKIQESEQYTPEQKALAAKRVEELKATKA